MTLRNTVLYSVHKLFIKWQNYSRLKKVSIIIIIMASSYGVITRSGGETILSLSWSQNRGPLPNLDQLNPVHSLTSCLYRSKCDCVLMFSLSTVTCRCLETEEVAQCIYVPGTGLVASFCLCLLHSQGKAPRIQLIGREMCCTAGQDSFRQEQSIAFACCNSP